MASGTTDPHPVSKIRGKIMRSAMEGWRWTSLIIPSSLVVVVNTSHMQVLSLVVDWTEMDRT